MNNIFWQFCPSIIFFGGAAFPLLPQSGAISFDWERRELGLEFLLLPSASASAAIVSPSSRCLLQISLSLSPSIPFVLSHLPSLLLLNSRECSGFLEEMSFSDCIQTNK